MNVKKMYEEEILKKCKDLDQKHLSDFINYMNEGKMSRFSLFAEFSDNSMEGFNIEILQNMFLILDDIMDKAVVRRKKACYHLVAENPVADSFALLNMVYKMTAKPFVFGKNCLRTCLGQYLDLKGEIFTKENYFNIADYKTGFYSLNLPLELAGIESDNLEMFTRLFGRFYQMLDDAINFLQKEKTSRDLEEHKVTWFTVWIKSEYSHFQCVQNFFEKKVISEELVDLCTKLARSQEFKDSLNLILEEITEIVKNDPVLTKAYSIMLASRKEVADSVLV